MEAKIAEAFKAQYNVVVLSIDGIVSSSLEEDNPAAASVKECLKLQVPLLPSQIAKLVALRLTKPDVVKGGYVLISSSKSYCTEEVISASLVVSCTCPYGMNCLTGAKPKGRHSVGALSGMFISSLKMEVDNASSPSPSLSSLPPSLSAPDALPRLNGHTTSTNDLKGEVTKLVSTLVTTNGVESPLATNSGRTSSPSSLDAAFVEATSKYESNVKRCSVPGMTVEQLEIEALHKYAQHGKCTTLRPLDDYNEKIKWDAYNSLSSDAKLVSVDDAKLRYIARVSGLIGGGPPMTDGSEKGGGVKDGVVLIKPTAVYVDGQSSRRATTVNHVEASTTTGGKSRKRAHSPVDEVSMDIDAEEVLETSSVEDEQKDGEHSVEKFKEPDYSARSWKRRAVSRSFHITSTLSNLSKVEAVTAYQRRTDGRRGGLMVDKNVIAGIEHDSLDDTLRTLSFRSVSGPFDRDDDDDSRVNSMDSTILGNSFNRSPLMSFSTGSPLASFESSFSFLDRRKVSGIYSSDNDL